MICNYAFARMHTIYGCKDSEKNTNMQTEILPYMSDKDRAHSVAMLTVCSRCNTILLTGLFLWIIEKVSKVHELLTLSQCSLFRLSL